MTAALAAFRRPGSGGGGGGLLTVTAVALTTWEYSDGINEFVASVDASTTGGLAPYTYVWSVLSGDASLFFGPIVASANYVSPSGATATLSVNATDANGATATSNIITISL